MKENCDTMYAKAMSSAKFFEVGTRNCAIDDTTNTGSAQREGTHMPNGIKWNDRFSIGVDAIDSAHKRLFTIVGELLSLNEDMAKQQDACKEGIKYFNSYAMKHFAEEEAYMKSVGYAGYAVHKSLHDSLRDDTLPALEAEMEEHDYSKESVRHFLGICIGWLNAHIMIEDYAITGKSPSKWTHLASENDTDSLCKTFINSLETLCHSKAQVVSQHYGGEDFASGKTICCRLAYLAKDKSRLQFYFVFEESLALHTLSAILSQEIAWVDQTAISAMQILSEQFVGTLKRHFMADKKYLLEKSELIDFGQFVRAFDKEYPPYSLLFSVGGKGYCAFCAGDSL